MRSILILLTALACMPYAVAQDKPPTIKAAFYAFGYAPNLKNIYIRTDKEAYQIVKLSSANIVGPFKPIYINGAITLHTMATDDEGNVSYPLVGQAKISGNIGNALIILIPKQAEDGSSSYQARVIDKSDTNFAQGSYKMVNFSKFPIRGAIGNGTRFTCAPGKITTFKTKGSPGEMIPVLMQYKHAVHWQRLTESRWVHSTRGRTLLCAYGLPGTKRVRIRSIPDNSKN